ncbi:TonB-dependent receptor [Draconibacterium sp. IB214405]|uniref:TonB-dependent receptor n=1 Tax=Draconibacterium sp. IB214405 TaxID=3097352 RepID=UPI002A10A14A|nr:TonB-dependent receptor [Draconibacterium sp. IB214405]MDX8339662.1 TonB-dependent receptor [Draconibacterium sp. IB214405]
MKKYILLLFILFPFISKSQSISGTVFSNDENGKQPLPGVNVVWEGTSEGTASKPDGSFKLKKKSDQHMLVFSFVGYESQTVHVHDEDPIEVVLQPNLEIEEVTVIKKNRGTYLSVINPIQTESISGAELHKAACCNLAESFETNPSVDVSYSDAVTGAKQIKLLGLDGTYSQLQVENIPNLRGLATTFGLTYIPGPWLESIQVSKGAASVLNGYESIAGQINAELKKPDSNEKLFLNVYGNNEGRYEFNGNTNIKVIGDTLTTGVFVHASNLSKENDHNHDGFLDSPLSETFEVANRWKYNNHKGGMAQAGITLLRDDRMGGQVGADRDMTPSLANPYGVNIVNNRVDAFFKSGIVSQDNHRAVAILTNFARHETESYYGLTTYDADETRFYGSVVYTQDLDEAAIHVLNSGASFIYDDFNEKLYDQDVQRTEKVPGLFTEYTFKPNDNLTLMAGVRADFHNIFGNFVTPRMHFRYHFADHFTFRTSAGKGYRTANVISENSYMLANSRPISWTEDVMQEEAWNYGVAFVQNYMLLDRELTINTEFFRTDFQSKLVLDRETSSEYILLLPSTETAYANSLQFDVRWQPIERLDMLLAYRVNNIKETIGGELMKAPLASDYKGLINLNYTTNLKKWMFDYTIQFNGGGRIPYVYEEWMNTADMSADFAEFSPYTIMNAQITKYFRYWNIYLGVENLTDFTQSNPIDGADDPFGDSFSATNIWGPTMGRKIYLGLRFNLNYD